MFTMHIDTESGIPMYTQIYKYIRTEIEAGRMHRSDRLPSTRALAEHLQVSRNTIDMAYGQLIDEGYIEAKPKRGYYVCDISANISPVELQPEDAEEGRQSAREQADTDYEYIFSPYGVDLANFPYRVWRKTMRDILYDDRNIALFEAGTRQGDLQFRQAVSEYLHQNRGVNCDPDQMIIGAGTDYLLMLLAQILPEGSIFALEDPSYMQAWRVLTHLHVRVDPIGLDRYGMDIQALEKSEANIAYVTPSHQFPTGIVMPAGRRREILSWADQRGDRYVIEDDYDSEFRYKGRPIPSLSGIDKHQKVIYMGTFSKAIAPSMRISYLVLPPKLLQVYRLKYGFYSNTVPRTEQKQMTEFIRQGHFERHLNRMRLIYKAKRDYILKALEPYQDRIEIYGENSGLHMLIHFKDGRSEEALLARAAGYGLRFYALSDYTVVQEHKKQRASTLILGYAAMTQDELVPAMQRFIECFLL